MILVAQGKKDPQKPLNPKGYWNQDDALNHIPQNCYAPFKTIKYEPGAPVVT